MHILFLTENFPPEVNAPASRTFEHARLWVQAGARVTVVTTAPNFPAGRIHAGYRNRWKSRETVAGIEVIRVWSFVAVNEGFARRLADFLSFMVTGTLAGLRVRKPDVVVATSPQFFTAVAGWAVAALKRAPFVFELRDLWPESIKAVGAMRESVALRWIERLELFLYRRAARIVAVTHAFKRVLAERGIDPAKIAVVTNGADLSRFAPRANDAGLRRRLGLEGRFVASYIGTHGMAHALETLVDAALLLDADPSCAPVTFLLLGGGAEKRAVQTYAAQRGAANVLFCDPVERDAVAGYWAISDCTIVHLRDTPLFRTVIPSKLFEAMAMGVPIVLGVDGEAAELVIEAGAGIAVPPENAVALAEAVRTLASDRELRRALSKAGAAAAGRFDRARLAEEMLAVLQAACASPIPAKKGIGG